MDLAKIIEDLGNSFSEFKTHHNGQLKAISDRLERVETERNRPGFGGDAPGGDVKVKQALIHYIKTGDASGLEQKAFSISGGTGGDEGGVTVPVQLHNQIVSALAQSSALFGLAQLVQTSSNDFRVILSEGEFSSEWISDDEATRNESTTPTFKEIQLPSFELSAMPKASTWLISDSAYDVEEWILREVDKTFAAKVETALVSGNGTTSPVGILSKTFTSGVDGARNSGELQYVASGNASQLLDPDPLVDLVSAVRPAYLASAYWVMNSKTYSQIRKFQSSDGEYLLGPLADNGAHTLLGHPIRISHAMPDIGADSIPVLFGSFAHGLYVGLRQPIQVLRDPYTSKGQVKLWVHTRMASEVIDPYAIKGLKISLS